MDEKLLRALDALIEKYSKDTMQSTGPEECPLCVLYWDYNCEGCPNKYFKRPNPLSLGCADRSVLYPWISYYTFESYPTLKKFWTRYKELYVQGIANNQIMEILLQEFPDPKN